MITLNVQKTEKLSKFIDRSCEDLPYFKLRELLRKKDIKVNGKRISSDINVNAGDIVEIYYLPPKTDKFTCLFKDDNILIIDKKSGYTSESVYEDIVKEYNGAKFIHRLDRNTSGIMVFALNDLAERELLKGFKQRTFDKTYIAEVVGKPKKDSDILSAYLIKDEKLAEVKIFNSQVKGAVAIKTGYKVMGKRQDTSLLEVQLYTGKTHQIRAHLAFMGNPIVGDGKYGDYDFNRLKKVKTQRLKAYKFTFYFGTESPLYYLNGKTFTTGWEF